MARAGNKGPRSARRRATAQIALRLTPTEKAAVQRRAKVAGYDALAPWVRARLEMATAPTTARDAMLVGKLGQIGGTLGDLARTWDSRSSEEVQRLVAALSLAIAQMQQILMTHTEDSP